jgi:hypothetical protein
VGWGKIEKVKKDSLSPQDVKTWVENVVADIPHNECLTCDCFHGFLTQLMLDTDEDVSRIIDQFKIGRDQMHGCLGCDPCPPGAAYARYLKTRSG